MQKPLRILQLGRFDFSEEKGGVQFYAESLFQFSPKEVVIDQLVSARGPKTKVQALGNRLKVSVATYGTWLSVPFSPLIFFWVWRLVWSRNYDLIHLNFPDPLGMLATWFLPKKIPRVVTWHSDVIRQKKALRWYMPMVQAYMQKVSKILVATPMHLSSCPQLKSLKMDPKIQVIEFGLDPSKWDLSPANQASVQALRRQYPQKLLLFTFGRHVYYKGYEYLIESLKDLKNVHLWLGGSGPLTEALKDQAEKQNVNDKITFLGKIPDEDIPIFLHACDIFCFPSVDTSEAFGYAQLEAMMCGKPVISGDLKNGVNYVNINGETGLAVPPRDAKALAAAIQKLQADPELRDKLGKSAKVRANELFTVQRMVEKTLKAFEKLKSE
ncbi:MAG: glycosyltransferase [Pseudobdellovibrionaceae bacterium]